MRSSDRFLTATDLFVNKDNFIHGLKVIVNSGYGYNFENRKSFMYNNCEYL